MFAKNLQIHLRHSFANHSTLNFRNFASATPQKQHRNIFLLSNMLHGQRTQHSTCIFANSPTNTRTHHVVHLSFALACANMFARSLAPHFGSVCHQRRWRRRDSSQICEFFANSLCLISTMLKWNRALLTVANFCSNTCGELFFFFQLALLSL